jgi:peptidyl-prolyl cis-trans isomerase C
MNLQRSPLQRVIAAYSFAGFSAAFFAGALAANTPAIPADTVLISGRTAKVTKADFDQEIKNVPNDAKIDFLTNLSRMQRMLERMFLNKTAVSLARAEGFDKDPDVIAELNYSRENKLAALYLERLKDKIVVPDMEPRARENFRLNADKLAQPERVRASHILISTTKYSPAEAQKRAQEAHAKALAGENFESLVEAYSDDPSAATNKGDVGTFSAEKMVPEFSKAAFALTKPGEISAPVRSTYGYHIIRLVSRTPREPAVYEDHRKDLIEQAETSYRDSQIKLQIDTLIANEKPKADEKAVESLRLKLDLNQLLKQQKAAGAEPAPKK